MGKLEIVDDLLLPNETIVLRYTGPNPLRVCNLIPDLAEVVLEIEAKDVIEKVFKFDATGDPRWFYDVLSCQKGFDRWTKFARRFLVQGEQEVKTGKGNVEIRITGWLITSFEYSNFLQRAFWLFFNHAFYYRVRRRYYYIARDYLMRMRSELMEALGIRPPVE